MNDKKFSDAMSELDDKYVNEAISYNAKTTASIHGRRRITAALTAAIVALFLLGCAVVAAVYGDSIQNWFGHQWKAITGQPMSDGQTAVIEHLSQEIGASQTVGDVTVTVDSATVGDGTFYLLLRVEGLQLSDKYNYAFDEIMMEIAPDPLVDGGGLGGYGFQYQGIDGNGAALMLMDYNYAGMDGYVEDIRPLEVDLTLKNLVRNANTHKEKALAEGEWNYTFILDRTQLPEAISLPDTETMVMDLDKREEVPIVITNIVLGSVPKFV